MNVPTVRPLNMNVCCILDLGNQQIENATGVSGDLVDKQIGYLGVGVLFMWRNPHQSRNMFIV